MKIRVIDFGILTTHYKNYRDGVDLVNTERNRVLEQIQPIQKEMNAIINSATNGVILGNENPQQQSEKFQQLQQELVTIDGDYKAKNKKMVDELNTRCFEELSIIVSDWATENSIDVVSGKMEIIYCNGAFDVTAELLEILKEKGLYVNREVTTELETEKESY